MFIDNFKKIYFDGIFFVFNVIFLYYIFLVLFFDIYGIKFDYNLEGIINLG